MTGSGELVVFPGVRSERAPDNSGQAWGRLTDYRTACRIIAECAREDLAKNVADYAEAIRHAAERAGNFELERDAAEIRMRAERRLGELLAERKRAGLLHSGGRPKRIEIEDGKETGRGDRPVFDDTPCGAGEPVRLVDLGVTKDLSSRAQKLAALPDFDERIGAWRAEAEQRGGPVSTRLLADNPKGTRAAHDHYDTPPGMIPVVAREWRPRARIIWEPCSDGGPLAAGLREAGRTVMETDIRSGSDFFAFDAMPDFGAGPGSVAICTNPPFRHTVDGEVRNAVRDFIDHAFSLGVEEMCLVIPERLFACGDGRAQKARHNPAIFAQMDWREDYLGRGGDADRMLGVAIWDGPCAKRCEYQIWSRGEG